MWEGTRKRLARALRVRMDSAGGAVGGDGGGDAGLLGKARASCLVSRLLAMKRMDLVLRLRLLRHRLRPLGKRCGRRLRRASAEAIVAEIVAGGIVGEEIVEGGIAVDAIVEGVRVVDGIRGWTRCGSGSLRVGRGRRWRTMRLWI